MSTEDQPSLPGSQTAYYFAFLSYSRGDSRLAHWLHRALEAYRTSKSLLDISGKPVRRRLSPIFRDRTDLGSGGDLTETIKRALVSSDALIVLCSPSAAKSPWVNLEVETYLSLGRKDDIFPVIASGEPDSGDPVTECFPPALRGLGLIAADLRQIKQPNGRIIGDGRNQGKLKLIAGLLGVTLDALIQRERQRQRVAVMLSTAASIVFLGLAIAAASFGYLAYRNEQAATKTLYRLFAGNGWAALSHEDNALAARYALAGAQLDPTDIEQYRALLGAAYFENAEIYDPIKVGQIDVASVSPEGSAVLVNSDTGYRILEIPTGRQISAAGHKFLSAAEFSRDGLVVNTMYDSGEGHYVELRKTGNGILIKKIQYDGDENILSSDLSPDKSRVVMGASNSKNAASLWDANTDMHIFDLARQSNAVTAVKFSDDGKRIFTGDNEGTVNISDAGNGTLLTAIRAAHGIRSIGLAPDGTRIVTAGGLTAQIWDIIHGRLLVSLIGHTEEVESAAFSPEGSRVITASQDHTAIIWDAAEGRRMASLRHGYDVGAAGFSRDGRDAITVSMDGTIRIWDVSHLTQPWATLARDACNGLIAESARRFREIEIAAEPLLQAKWPDVGRDVCAGIEGVAPWTEKHEP